MRRDQMRRRFVAVFALLTAVLASVLTAASPAHAAGFDPVCSLFAGSQTAFQCVVPADPEDRVVDTIRWTRNGVDRPDDNDFRQIRLTCEPGEAVTVGLTVNFKEVDPATGQPKPAGQATGSTLFLCAPSAPLTLNFFDCDTGAGLLVCTVIFAGGFNPTVSWNIDGRDRPDMFNSTFIRTGCVVGKPYRAVVTVRDAFGSVTDVESHTCSRIQQ
jgi:hypothetical protein